MDSKLRKREGCRAVIEGCGLWKRTIYTEGVLWVKKTRVVGCRNGLRDVRRAMGWEGGRWREQGVYERSLWELRERALREDRGLGKRADWYKRGHSAVV